MLAELIAMRAQTAKAIERACEVSANGGGSGAGGVSKEDYDKVVAENKKLKCRVGHLLRALDEIDGGYQGGAAAAGGAKGGKAIKLYTLPLGDSTNYASLVQVVCQLTGQQVNWVEATAEIVGSKDMKKLNPAGIYPVAEVEEGVAICGFAAICKHLARSAGKLLGSNDVKKAQVDQWVNWTQTNLIPVVEQVMNGVYGQPPIYTAQWNEANKELKSLCKLVNNQLQGGYLVDGHLTLADVFVAVALAPAFQTVLDGGFCKAMKNAASWANQIYALKEVRTVLGAVRLCDKALKPSCLPDPAAPKQEKKEQPKKEE